jgi:ribonuclease HII
MARLGRLTIEQLRARYAERARSLPRALERELRQDGRSGVVALVKAVDACRRDNRSEGQRLRTMLRFERGLWQRGLELVAGVDEAGLGPLAGPVAAGAVILRPGTRLPGVDDSKKLSEKERERLAPAIRARALAWAVAFVEPEEVDRINIHRAGRLAMQRAVEALRPRPQHLLVDGRYPCELAIPQLSLIGGDGRSLSIAAASILAKTARDERMRAYEVTYPGYGFARHKGYGTHEHTRAMVRLGITPIHRRSFAPVQSAQSRLAGVTGERR